MRLQEASRPYQDYPYCYVKDLLCVVMGDCRVYTCCTLAATEAGLLGDLREKGLPAIWRETEAYRRDFDPRERCRTICLYEGRNLAMQRLAAPCLHGAFI
jgi:hypothetical protein